MARAKHARRKPTSIVSSRSQDQTRARICDWWLYAPWARNLFSAEINSTVAPGCGSPRTSAIAPENTHGWRRNNDFSRPGLRMSWGLVVMRTILVYEIRYRDRNS